MPFLLNKEQFIKDHPEIIITNADKCNKTVIMSKQEYNDKLQNMLNDSKTYKIQKSDQTKFKIR